MDNGIFRTRGLEKIEIVDADNTISRQRKIIRDRGEWGRRREEKDE